MSRTRTVFALALAGAMLVALTAQAQPDQGGPRGPRGGGMMGPGGAMGIGMLLRNDKVQLDLKLTDDQKEKIRGLGRELRQNREEGEKKLAEILNADQLKRLKEIRVQVGGVAVLVEAAIAKDLGLSEEQTTKLKELQQKSRESMREAMQGMRDLPQEERRAKMAELRPKMEQLQKEHMAQALEILTPDQRAKLEKMKGVKIEIDLSRPRGQRRAAATE